MIDITLANFESDLIQASLQQPVLLDIWAEWCGPCKALGPVLEMLETEYAGRFVLAKVNADEQQEIASQLSEMFGVRSIPFCVIFKDGQPIDGFVGALPPEEIRAFLDKHVPGEGEIASELETLEAEQLVEAGDTESALAKLEDAVAKDPSNDEARYDLIKLLLAEGALEGAQAIFAPIADRATGLLAEQRVNAFGRYIDALASARAGRSPAELSAAIDANKRDFATRFELAQIFFASGHFTDAMDELLEIIMRDKGWNDEQARKTYVAILDVMSKPLPKPLPAKAGAAAAGGAAGTDGKPQLEIAGKVAVTATDPVVDKYRRKLSSALF